MINSQTCTQTSHNTFSEDERGATAVTFALGALAMLMAAGVGVNSLMAFSAHRDAQTIADSVSLAASVYVTQNGTEPTSDDEGYLDEKAYDISEISQGGQSPFLKNSTVLVDYDLPSGEIRTHFEGEVDVIFPNLFGKDKLDIRITAASAYGEKKLRKPASLLFILDNSASMYLDDKPSAPWDQAHHDTEVARLVEEGYAAEDAYNTALTIPTGREQSPGDAQRRTDALKLAMGDINLILKDVVANQDPEKRVLRTSQLAFNSHVDWDISKRYTWDAVDENLMAGMEPHGETGTFHPLIFADNWQEHEAEIHEMENGEDDPLRYVVMLTDGQNSGGDRSFRPEEGGDWWLGEVYRTYSRCTAWENRERTYSTPEGGTRTETYRHCTERETKEGWVPRRVQQDTMPEEGRNWEQGVLRPYNDNLSRDRCDSLKESYGVQIFTVGFALESGTFASNEFEQTSGSPWQAVAPIEKERAVELLSYCASSEAHFTLASDTGELREEFKRIGETILKDVVRLTR